MRGREGRRKGGLGSGFGALDEESLPLLLEELIPPPPSPCSKQKYGREGCANGDSSDVVGRWDVLMPWGERLEGMRGDGRVALDQVIADRT